SGLLRRLPAASHSSKAHCTSTTMRAVWDGRLVITCVLELLRHYAARMQASKRLLCFVLRRRELRPFPPPHAERNRHRERQREPGNGVLHVLVAQLHLQRTWLGDAAWRHR